MNSDTYTIVGLGELLWDLFPAGKQLGGAPANFAYHSAALGNQGLIASRVGDDELGREALDQLSRLGLPTDYVQTDPTHPTGTVEVQVDEQGQPDYIITENVAWDFMEWTPAWQKLAAQTDAVCFGSLAQRSPQSRDTIRQFIKAVPSGNTRIYDVNLRQAFFSKEILTESLSLSEVVKLNDIELPQVIDILGLSGGNQEEGARALLQAYHLKLVCVTRGAHGSLLVTDTESAEHPGFPIKVADTVGAGDAFTVALVHHYLRKTPLAKIAEAANRMGSWVATQVGAMPAMDRQILKQVLGDT
jgi:fructokinase